MFEKLSDIFSDLSLFAALISRHASVITSYARWCCIGSNPDARGCRRRCDSVTLV